MNTVFCSTETRRCWAPQKQHWPWTGISVQPCCLCWCDVRLSLLIRSTTLCSWIPHFKPSTDCPRAALSPKPRETLSRSAFLPSASKSHILSCGNLTVLFLSLYKHALIAYLLRHLRPSMLQQLLRRLVFDVPQLTEYCKMPIKVSIKFQFQY